jgi:hypothetical protein
VSDKPIPEWSGAARDWTDLWNRCSAFEAALSEAQQERDGLRNVLRAALIESGCDGDLCMHDWHEAGRMLLGEYRFQQLEQVTQQAATISQLRAALEQLIGSETCSDIKTHAAFRDQALVLLASLPKGPVQILEKEK